MGVVLAVVTTLAVIGLGYALESGLSQFEGIENPVPDPIPDDPRLPPDGPPPDFGRAAGPEERLAHWLQTLAVGDQEDVVWAVRQLQRTRHPVRQDVIATAQRSIRSNSALLQRLLDFLSTQPEEDTVPLAMDCIGHSDQDVASRAAALLGLIGGEAARPAVPQLATAAVDREGKVPQRCLDALAHIGGPESEAALRDLVGKLSPGYRAYGYLALSRSDSREMIPFLRERFELEEEVETKLMAAEALIRLDDRAPLPWLKKLFRQRAPRGPIHDRVLTLLALAQDADALGFLRKELGSALLDGTRAEKLVPLAAFYPFQDVDGLLEIVARRDRPELVRVAAWEIRARGGGPATRKTLLRMLSSSGVDNESERQVAALVLGRLRDPAMRAPLVAELARGSSDRLRQMIARALVLCGDPGGAEAVARAMVDDRTDYGVGGTAFGVWRVFGEVTVPFAEAFGPAVAKALAGEWGQPDKAGLQHLILAAGRFCGPEVTADLSRHLQHPDAGIRQTAALVIAEIGGPGTLGALRAAWREPQEDTTREILRTALEHHHFRADRGR